MKEKYYSIIIKKSILFNVYLGKIYIKTNKNNEILKHLPKEKRQKYIDEYALNTIDPDTQIELTTEFSLDNLRKKNYSLPSGVGIKTSEFLSDLMKCVVIINTANMDFIVKEYDGVRKTYNLKHLTDKGFEKLLKSINLGKYYKDGKLKNVNAFMVYNEGKNKKFAHQKRHAILRYSTRYFQSFHRIRTHFIGGR